MKYLAKILAVLAIGLMVAPYAAGKGEPPCRKRPCNTCGTLPCNFDPCGGRPWCDYDPDSCDPNNPPEPFGMDGLVDPTSEFYCIWQKTGEPTIDNGFSYGGSISASESSPYYDSHSDLYTHFVFATDFITPFCNFTMHGDVVECLADDFCMFSHFEIASAEYIVYLEDLQDAPNKHLGVIDYVLPGFKAFHQFGVFDEEEDLNNVDVFKRESVPHDPEILGSDGSIIFGAVFSQLIDGQSAFHHCPLSSIWIPRGNNQYNKYPIKFGDPNLTITPSDYDIGSLRLLQYGPLRYFYDANRNLTHVENSGYAKIEYTNDLNGNPNIESFYRWDPTLNGGAGGWALKGAAYVRSFTGGTPV